MALTGEFPAVYATFFGRLAQYGLLTHSSASWEAFCPLCEPNGGRSRSLSVKLGGEGRLLVKCHSPSKCPTPDVMKALDLGEEYLFPDNPDVTGNNRGEQRREFVCAYQYHDEQQRLLFEVVRWRQTETGKKVFSQRRPNPDFDTRKPPSGDNPRWLRGTEGCRRVVYRLPELLKALAERPDRWVFVVEGEKATDYLRARGLTATTNPMGAGKWHPDYSEFLRGCRVAVVPDEDPPDEKGHRAGLDHAREVCLSLYGVAGDVRMVRLAKEDSKQGLDDWVAAVGDKAFKKPLLAAVETAEPFRPVDADLPPPVQLLVAELARFRAARGVRGTLVSRLEWLGAVREGMIRFESSCVLGANLKPSAEAVVLAARLLAGVEDFR